MVLNDVNFFVKINLIPFCSFVETNITVKLLFVFTIIAQIRRITEINFR